MGLAFAGGTLNNRVLLATMKRKPPEFARDSASVNLQLPGNGERDGGRDALGDASMECMANRGADGRGGGECSLDGAGSARERVQALRSQISGVLHEWRKRNNLKLSTAAAQIGVSAAAWGYWEEGKRFPDVEHLVALAETTGIPIQHFFCPNREHCPFRRGKRI